MRNDARLRVRRRLLHRYERRRRCGCRSRRRPQRDSEDASGYRLGSLRRSGEPRRDRAGQGFVERDGNREGDDDAPLVADSEKKAEPVARDGLS